jgi:protein-disulfide isomerase
MKTRGIVLALALGSMAIAPALAEPAKPAAAATAGPVGADKMSDRVSFEGLSAEQKALAVSIVNENQCDCGCGMKVAECIVKDAKCTRSVDLAKQVIELVKKGKSKDEIVKSVLTPPTKFIEFALNAGDAPAIGPKSAKVTILHYFDYQCPFCSRIAPTLDQIVKEYGDNVRIVFKMRPLSMHPNAMPAAEAAMAAKAQGKFFEMHKRLFENQSQLTRDNFLKFAKEIGLDVDKFTKDLDSHKYAEMIQKEGKEMDDIGASGTPASFVNGRYVTGAKPFSFFKDMIDEELAWAKAGKRPEFKIGKNVSETQVRTASSGPDPNKVYDLVAGDTPFRGPASAKVTILHYLDYQ